MPLLVVAGVIRYVSVGLIASRIAFWVLPVDPPAWLHHAFWLPLVTIAYLAGRAAEVASDRWTADTGRSAPACAVRSE